MGHVYGEGGKDFEKLSSSSSRTVEKSIYRGVLLVPLNPEC